MRFIIRTIRVCSVFVFFMCVNVLAETPVARDDIHLTKINTSVTCYPLANDSDGDPEDSLSIQSFDATSSKGGTISDNGNGTLRYTPAGGFAGLDTFGYIVTDGSGSSSGTVSVSVNAVYDIGDARDDILSGVSALGNPSGASGCVAFGPTAYSIGHYGGENRSDPVIAAATLGHGRVIAMPDHQWLRMNSFADEGQTGRYYLNALAWLAGTSSKDIKIVCTKIDNNDSDVWLQSQGFTNVVKSSNYAVELADADVLVGWLGSSMSQSDVDIIQEFARNGGGLFLSDYGIGYVWWWQTGIVNAPGNRVLRHAGIGFAKEGGGSLDVDRSTGQTTSEDVIDMLTDSSGYSSTDLDIGGTVMGRIFDILPEGDTLLARLDEKFYEQIDSINPSPSNPISNSFEKSLVRRESSILSNTPVDEVAAHRTAEAVYGEIPVGAERVTRTLNYNVPLEGRDTRGNDSVIWLSTGLYVVPGEIVTVSVSSSVINKGMKVKINGDWNDISGRDYYLRMPFGTSREFALDSTTIDTANAFGGLIYIVIPKNTVPGVFDVTIENAIEAPYFILGEHTNDDWINTIRSKPAPWVEMVCDNLIITLSKDKVADLDKAEELMTFWNDGVAAQDDLAGLVGRKTRPERMYSMIQTAWGGGYAGYPIGAWNWDFGDYEAMELGECWGEYHENGHLHQSGYWTDGRTGEVTVNIFSMRAIEAVCDSGRAATGWGTQWDPWQRVSKYQASGGFDAGSLSERLVMYSQLKVAFGWDAFKHTFQTYHDDEQSNPGALPGNDQEEWDQFMVRFSREVGYDLSPFFVDWEFGVSQAAINSLSDLGDWNMLEIYGDSYTVSGGGSVEISNPASNDYSFDGVTVLVSVESPEHGTLTDNGGGSYTYNAKPGFFGTDTFSYTVRNGYNNIFTGVVTLNVIDSRDGLEVYYAFDNSNSNVKFLYDMSAPVKYIASPRGPSTGVAGHIDEAFGFDGSTDYVDVPALNLFSNTVTITGWINRSGSQNSYCGIIFCRGGATVAGLNFYGTTNRLGYHWNNAANTYNFDSGLLVPDNEWAFIALVVEPNKATLYVNGQSAVNNASHSIEEFNGTMYLGRDASSSRFYEGGMDEVSIWSRSLGPDEIATLYASGRDMINGLPVFDGDPVIAADSAEGMDYETMLTSGIFDPEENSMVFSKVSGPAWLSVGSDGSVSGVPGAGDIGVNDLVVEVTDALGGVVQGGVSITVHNLFNGDMGFTDFARFAAQWLVTDCVDFPACGGCDLDGDDDVDGFDMIVFASNWLDGME